MSTPRGIKRKIACALKATSREISGNAAQGRYAAALASEGYAGGYRDALNDVLLALNGVEPNRYPYWPRERSVSKRRHGAETL